MLLAPLVLSAALRDLWAPDEPRYAMVARWIYEQREFLVMRRCGELYPDKPPMLYWIAGLCGVLSDWSTFAMRGVSLVSMALVAWITSRMARRWLGELEAQWAPVLFLGFFMIVEIGGRLQIDPLLTLGCVGALECATTPARDTRHATRLVLGGALLAALGTFAKGPVALVNVGLPLLALRFLGPQPDGARAPRQVWILALVVSLLPVATWAASASLVEPALWRPLFLGQHLERAAKGTAHPGPPWQNLLRMPALLLPWIAPVLLGLWASSTAIIARWKKRTAHAGLLRVGLWFWVLFLFFSIIPTKRDMYLLSAYPACALLGAHALAEMLRRERIARATALVPVALFAVLGLALVAALPIADGLATRAPKLQPSLAVLSELRERHPSLGARSVIVGALFLCGALATAFAWRSGRVARWANTVALAWLGGLAALITLIIPLVDPLKSDRGTAALLAALPQRPSEIPCYGTAPDGVRFYGGGPCFEAEPAEWKDGRFTARMEREGAQFLALIEDDDFARMAPELRERLRILAEDRVGSRRILVLGAK